VKHLTILAGVIALAGCATLDEHAASDPLGPVIGRTAIELYECAGAPSRTMELTPDLAIAEWDNVVTSSKAAFAMTLPMGFSVEAGRPASCHMVATLSDTGTVMRVEFAGLGVVDDGAACSQMIRACIQHPQDTSTRPVGGFDFLMLPTTTKPAKP
jgi:hypothetical protein